MKRSVSVLGWCARKRAAAGTWRVTKEPDSDCLSIYFEFFLPYSYTITELKLIVLGPFMLKYVLGF